VVYYVNLRFWGDEIVSLFSGNHRPGSEVAGAQTLRRGLSILHLLARVGPAGLRVSDIGRRLQLNKTTAIRLTRTLLDEGFVLHDRASGYYRLGPEAFAVGLAAEPSFALQRLAAPMLRELAVETGDTVFFTVLHGDETICLSRDEGDFPIRNQLIKPGDRWPLGVGGGACAMLAALSDAEVDGVLARNAALRAEKFPRCTDAALRTLIASTRARGFCVQPGLVLEDSWAVAVAVYDTAQRPVASISVAAVRSRLGAERSAALGEQLCALSARLTELQALSADSLPAS
jgi:DNA-binding IclR family transcriptional regulator